MPTANHVAPVKLAPIRNDWVSKSTAGVVLGLVLALEGSALLAALTTSIPLVASAQLAMWVVPPIWMSVLGMVYFFSSGLRAWVGLGAASLMFYAGLRLAGAL